MASEPVPEPLTNQGVDSRRETTFPDVSPRRPELVDPTPPRTSPDRELPRAPRIDELKQTAARKVEDVKQNASRAARRAKETTSRAVDRTKDKAAATYGEAKDRAAAFYEVTRQNAADTLDQAGRRARYVMDEYPLQVIAGVAAAAFLVGALLRIWRSSRDA
jgi:hypothetical protein